MSKKRPDPFAAFAAFAAVISQLARLTHDEHRDLADMLTADLADDWRSYPHRHGLPPVYPDDGHNLILRGGWKYRDDPPLYTAPARDELQQAYASADDLPPEARRLIIQVARMLQNALAPIAERRRDPDGQPIATGNIQTKIIHRKIVDPDTGEVEIKAFGPYLYYRYLATGGDADKRGKRLKNKYIGLPNLAEQFDRTATGSPERRDLERRIIEAMHGETLDALMQELGLSHNLPNPTHEADEDTPDEPPDSAAGLVPLHRADE
jgi:hypothetical protein